MSPLSAAPVVSFHTHCLQEDASLVPPGPGAFAAILRAEFRIHGPADVGMICLPAGTPLLGSAHVDSLSDAVHGHLYGTITDSDLRLGVALFIGHEPHEGFDHPLASVVRDDIDGWLGANTAFVFWPGSAGKAVPKSDGVFAGIARSWATRNGCFGLTSLQ